MIEGFKKFIMRGNVMDLAVAVIIGGVFGKIVGSLTDDLLMPVISLFTGKIDFDAHIQERFAFLEDASEELTQPGHQTACLAQGKDSGVVGFFVEHIASMLHRVI